MKDIVIDLGIAKIKLEQVEEKRIILVCKCPFCDRRVRGSTHSQMEWNLVLHIRQKHNDEEEAKILLNQLEEQNKS